MAKALLPRSHHRGAVFVFLLSFPRAWGKYSLRWSRCFCVGRAVMGSRGNLISWVAMVPGQVLARALAIPCALAVQLVLITTETPIHLNVPIHFAGITIETLWWRGLQRSCGQVEGFPCFSFSLLILRKRPLQGVFFCLLPNACWDRLLQTPTTLIRNKWV